MKTKLPEDWRPDQSDIAYFNEHTPWLEFRDQVDHFKFYWWEKETLRKNWSLTWKRWVLNAKKYNPRPNVAACHKQTDNPDWLTKDRDVESGRDGLREIKGKLRMVR